MIDYGIKGKVAVVTGAAGDGLGRADVLALAKCGAKIAVVDINPADETVKLASELGATAKSYTCDISKEDQVKAAIEKIRSDLGPIQILVNNASILTTVGKFEDIPTERWNRDVEINTMGTANVTRAVWPDMQKAQWGRIVMMSSIAGTYGGLGQSSYSATKASLIGLAKTLALEGARLGITANVIAPGVIKSQMAMNGLRGDMLERMKKATAMRRFGELNEIADTVTFLCSQQSSYVTGQVIHVDGGLGLFVF
ncbi:SDR family oxidoreductase [bacterium]|nr:SDR family oxidoreductase [bacterium]